MLFSLIQTTLQSLTQWLSIKSLAPQPVPIPTERRLR